MFNSGVLYGIPLSLFFTERFEESQDLGLNETMEQLKVNHHSVLANIIRLAWAYYGRTFSHTTPRPGCLQGTMDRMSSGGS